MLIGERLRELRGSRKFSQGDLERLTGLLRCYTSRVENGHTVPSIETLEKYARALEVPLYRLFYEGDEPPQKPKLPLVKEDSTWGTKVDEWRELRIFCKSFARMNNRQRQILLTIAQRLAGRPRVSRTTSGSGRRRS